MRVASGDFHIGFYTTTDPFDKVVAFYRAIYKETEPAPVPTNYRLHPLSVSTVDGYRVDGYQMREAWFVLDGASDLATSKSWITVSHPWAFRRPAGLVGRWHYFMIKNVTVIEWIQNRS